MTGLTAACVGEGDEVVLPPPDPEGDRPEAESGNVAAELNLADLLSFTSPVEGQLSDLSQEVYDLIGGEQCYVAVTSGEAEMNYGRILRASATAASVPAVEPAADAAAEPDPAQVAQLINEGETVYERRCATCHGNEGGGSQAPPLLETVSWRPGAPSCLR